MFRLKMRDRNNKVGYSIWILLLVWRGAKIEAQNLEKTVGGCVCGSNLIFAVMSFVHEVVQKHAISLW